MGLIKIIIVFFIGWVLYGVYRRWQTRLPEKPAKADEKIDTMVKCAQCGVHFPEKNAIEHNGQFFCCKEHKDSFIK